MRSTHSLLNPELRGSVIMGWCRACQWNVTLQGKGWQRGIESNCSSVSHGTGRAWFGCVADSITFSQVTTHWCKIPAAWPWSLTGAMFMLCNMFSEIVSEPLITQVQGLSESRECAQIAAEPLLSWDIRKSKFDPKLLNVLTSMFASVLWSWICP